MPLSSSIDNLVDLRRQAYTAYRANLGRAGEHLPADLASVVTDVIAYGDSLASAAPGGTTWDPHRRRWIIPPAR
jgi:hypothetical protein